MKKICKLIYLNKIYRCISGELSKQYCAGGLHWNRNKNICDWPASAQCKDLGKHFSLFFANLTWKCFAVYSNTGTARPSTAPFSKSTQYNSMTTPSTPTNSNSNCDEGAYYPHEHCSQFYICVNNNLMAQNCAPGLNWDPNRGMCDWKFKVQCSGRRRLAEKFTVLHNLAVYSEFTWIDQFRNDWKFIYAGPQPYSTCQQNIFAPYPGDCTQYLQCLWGKYEVFHCSPGLYWNSVSVSTKKNT